MDSVDKREKCLQRRRERERSRRASETAEEREERLIKRRVSKSMPFMGDSRRTRKAKG